MSNNKTSTTVKPVASFSLRTLFALVFVAALGCAGFLLLRYAWWDFSGKGPITDTADWPESLKAALEDDPTALRCVRVYGLSDFIDTATIWQIQNGDGLLQQLIAENNLECATPQHPMATELFNSIPSGLPRPDPDKSAYYATPNFGTVHIEGYDLLLVVADVENNCTIVLHHWNF